VNEIKETKTQVQFKKHQNNKIPKNRKTKKIIINRKKFCNEKKQLA